MLHKHSLIVPPEMQCPTIINNLTANIFTSQADFSIVNMFVLSSFATVSLIWWDWNENLISLNESFIFASLKLSTIIENPHQTLILLNFVEDT